MASGNNPLQSKSPSNQGDYSVAQVGGQRAKDVAGLIARSCRTVLQAVTQRAAAAVQKDLTPLRHDE